MGVGSCLLLPLICAAGEASRAQPASTARRISWNDVAPVRAILEAKGLAETSFAAYVERVHAENVRRVREGDLDHLIFYLLQSTHFTAEPAIEPALSAKALVGSLGPAERDLYLRTTEVAVSRIAAPVRARAAALLRALGRTSRDPRLVYFRSLVEAAFPDVKTRETALLGEYLRAMRFVYEKEFVAQRADRPAEAVADLYRSRGLSTDTAVEAGFLVSQGLGVIRALEPARRIRRVLIVGPGLNLAPRTGFLDASPPESYQPWAVIDALIDLGLSTAGDLLVVGADINPRVVSHLRKASTRPPVLTLVSEIRHSETVTLSAEYRDYFASLGQGIGSAGTGPGTTEDGRGHLRKIVRIREAVGPALTAQPLDIVTERLAAPGFDLVVATNILPYFDDAGVTLALSNIASMLTPGGMFLHNESRPLVRDAATALGLPLQQSRHAVIATVRGAATPLFDSVWIHRKGALTLAPSLP